MRLKKPTHSAHEHIATGHILLGLLREGKSLAAKILRDCGADVAALRLEARKVPEGYHPGTALGNAALRSGRVRQDTIEIHGSPFDADHIRDAVKRLRQHNWDWHKQPWKPKDIVVHRQRGSISFDLTLAQDAANFELVKAGWKTDPCAVCHWALLAKEDPSHGEGYTNGRDWLCTECYEKFWSRPDFFSSAYSDIT